MTASPGHLSAHIFTIRGTKWRRNFSTLHFTGRRHRRKHPFDRGPQIDRSSSERSSCCRQNQHDSGSAT